MQSQDRQFREFGCAGEEGQSRVVEQDLNETASETPAALARRNLDFLASL